MDQLAVDIKIDDYWNPQLHALLIFSWPVRSARRAIAVTPVVRVRVPITLR